MFAMLDTEAKPSVIDRGTIASFGLAECVKLGPSKVFGICKKASGSAGSHLD